MFDGLTAQERKELDQLLVIAVAQRRTPFQTIQRLPQPPSRKHLEETIDHLEWLDTLGSVGTELKGIAPSLIGEFARQARTADAAELKDVTPAKRYTLLLCLIHNTKARTRDAVASMAVQRIATIHERAKDELRQRQLEQQQRVNELLGKFGEVIAMVAAESNDSRAGRPVRTLWSGSGKIEALQQEYSAAKGWTGNNYLPLLWAHYKNNRPVLFRAINARKLKPAAEGHNALLQAWSVLCEKPNPRLDWIPLRSAPLSFASQRWRRLLQHPADPAPIHRRQLEVCALSYIADHLQAGNLCVPGSETFADHRAEWLPWPECERQWKDFCDRMGLPATADEFVKPLQRQLTEVAAPVDEQFPQNTAVTIGAKGEAIYPAPVQRASYPGIGSAIACRGNATHAPAWPARHSGQCGAFNEFYQPFRPGFRLRT